MFLTKSYLWCVAWVLCLTVACIGVGCGTGDDVVTPTEPEVVEVTEVTETVQVITRFDGERIYFEQGGTIYEGRVVEGVSATDVLVRVDDGGGDMVISAFDIKGTLIADHPDIGIEVVLRGDWDKGEKRLSGRIVTVYDNGVRKIKLLTVTLVDNTFEKLDVPRIRFVHEDTDYNDGGYLTLDELARIIGGG